MELFPKNPILVVDDEQHILESIEITLNFSQITNVVCMNNSAEALEYVRQNKVEVIITDLIMPVMNGNELLKKVKEEFPDIPVIVVTGVNEVEIAIDCMKDGAVDYILKPVEKNRIISSIRRAVETRKLQYENQTLKNYMLTGTLKKPENFSHIITVSEKMLSIFRYIEAISSSRQPVLITGETGTGKELAAQAVHAASERTGEFVAVNVAGVDDNMFSDSLFGHKKGAFTGAVADRAGLVESARLGTLFLDEIGDLSHTSQLKLLRLLQESRYYSLGSDVAKKADVRVVVATNKTLDELADSSVCRKDLYYRLQTHHIQLPPLRERKDDIPVLLHHFLDSASEEMKKKKPSFPGELVTLLGTYSFPGNIREFRSMIFDAVSKHEKGILAMDSFKHVIGNAKHSEIISEKPVFFGTDMPTIDEMEKILVAEALRRADNNQTIAASLLGISRQTLNRKLGRDRE